jgi:hypothetical protein
MSEIKVNKLSPRTNCGTVTVGDAGDSVTVTAGVPVTVNGDLKSNALKAVDGGSIISQCGTNITLGASGDTINLAAGASQTGFGRTGTVDWDTTAKTALFTAVSGNGYFVNTTSGAITVTLPAGSAGDIVSLADYAATWQTNNLTVSPDGTDKIGGVNSDVILSTEGQSVTFIYSDATQGWLNTMDSTSNVRGASFIAATGGTTTTCGDFKIHTFTGPGTFCVSALATTPTNNIVDYLVVAGGGGAGLGWGGGGGAGGFREAKDSTLNSPHTASPLAATTGITVTATGYPVTVGGAGTSPPGTQGSSSIFSTITSAGGGAGGGENQNCAGPGGSGGGAARTAGGGSGNTPPVSPPQGQPGGGGTPNSGNGGGGATQAGISNTTAGGGAGAGTGINPSPTVGTPGPTPGVRYFSGGGRGCAPAGGFGGVGGGSPAIGGYTPIANTGGGGQGDANNAQSGIVIIRYKYQ